MEAKVNKRMRYKSMKGRDNNGTTEVRGGKKTYWERNAARTTREGGIMEATGLLHGQGGDLPEVYSERRDNTAVKGGGKY